MKLPPPHPFPFEFGPISTPWRTTLFSNWWGVRSWFSMQDGSLPVLKHSFFMISYFQLRARRALTLFNDVLLRTRRAVTLFNDVPLRTGRALTLFNDVLLRTRRALTLFNDVPHWQDFPNKAFIVRFDVLLFCFVLFCSILFYFAYLRILERSYFLKQREF